jgi:predicted RNA-binding Zn ribbon-like protein
VPTATEAQKPFKWVGGNIALDFANTADWEAGEPVAGELFPTTDRLLHWAREAGILTQVQAEGLRGPAEDPRALDRALSLRRTIHGVFAAVARGEPPAAVHLEELNAWLAEVPPQVAVASPDPSFTWTWTDAGGTLDGALRPVAWAAANLLTSAALEHLRICANQRCGWLFIDRSRRHNRKWCEMGVCGNRAKARRFHRRQREDSR